MKPIEPGCQAMVIGFDLDGKAVQVIEKLGTSEDVNYKEATVTVAAKSGCPFWRIDGKACIGTHVRSGDPVYTDFVPEVNLIRIDGYDPEEEDCDETLSIGVSA